MRWTAEECGHGEKVNLPVVRLTRAGERAVTKPKKRRRDMLNEIVMLHAPENDTVLQIVRCKEDHKAYPCPTLQIASKR